MLLNYILFNHLQPVALEAGIEVMLSEFLWQLVPLTHPAPCPGAHVEIECLTRSKCHQGINKLAYQHRLIALNNHDAAIVLGAHGTVNDTRIALEQCLWYTFYISPTVLNDKTLLEQVALAAASGRRAHHRCSVLGWPWRMDFSRADSALISSRGIATSISFFFCSMVSPHFFLRLRHPFGLPQLRAGKPLVCTSLFVASLLTRPYRSA